MTVIGSPIPYFLHWGKYLQVDGALTLHFLIPGGRTLTGSSPLPGSPNFLPGAGADFPALGITIHDTWLHPVCLVFGGYLLIQDRQTCFCGSLVPGVYFPKSERTLILWDTLGKKKNSQLNKRGKCCTGDLWRTMMTFSIFNEGSEKL